MRTQWETGVKTELLQHHERRSNMLHARILGIGVVNSNTFYWFFYDSIWLRLTWNMVETASIRISVVSVTLRIRGRTADKNLLRLTAAMGCIEKMTWGRTARETAPTWGITCAQVVFDFVKTFQSAAGHRAGCRKGVWRNTNTDCETNK